MDKNQSIITLDSRILKKLLDHYETYGRLRLFYPRDFEINHKSRIDGANVSEVNNGSDLNVGDRITGVNNISISNPSQLYEILLNEISDNSSEFYVNLQIHRENITDPITIYNVTFEEMSHDKMMQICQKTSDIVCTVLETIPYSQELNDKFIAYTKSNICVNNQAATTITTITTIITSTNLIINSTDEIDDNSEPSNNSKLYIFLIVAIILFAIMALLSYIGYKCYKKRQKELKEKSDEKNDGKKSIESNQDSVDSNQQQVKEKKSTIETNTTTESTDEETEEDEYKDKYNRAKSIVYLYEIIPKK